MDFTKFATRSTGEEEPSAWIIFIHIFLAVFLDNSFIITLPGMAANFYCD